MHSMSDKYLLQIEPKCQKSEVPVNDGLTHKMSNLLASAVEGVYQRGNFVANDSWRGRHTCDCGERSGSKDLMVKSGHITNSLAVHYLTWHRSDIPICEIEKLRSI